MRVEAACLAESVADALCFRYQPPNLAISTLYWKAWPLLLVVAAFNPENIGEPSARSSSAWRRRLFPGRLAVRAWVELGRGRVLVVAKGAAVSLPSGLAAWEEYPTLKMLMEMVMTKYAGPPAAEGAEGARVREVRTGRAPAALESGAALGPVPRGLVSNLRPQSLTSASSRQGGGQHGGCGLSLGPSGQVRQRVV